MRPRLVTFDCAETLVRVNWSVGDYALDCARHIGLDLPDSAGSRYRQMYHERLPEFLQVNLTRDPAQGETFWLRLGRDWLRELGLPESLAPNLQAASEILGFGQDSILFQLYDDVIPCLQALRADGHKLGVVSNWDYSLHKTLRSMEIANYFDFAIASLEEGFEKPDPRIFHLAARHGGVQPADILHVGDNPIDDLQGAREAGLRAVLIDRSRSDSVPPYLHTLNLLPEAFAWSG
jgi:REG-2-like HAD superfamily hydrolase